MTMHKQTFTLPRAGVLAYCRSKTMHKQTLTLPCAGVLAYCRGMTMHKQTTATLAEYLREATPYARFIVMFRDPVDRWVRVGWG